MNDEHDLDTSRSERRPPVKTRGSMTSGAGVGEIGSTEAASHPTAGTRPGTAAHRATPGSGPTEGSPRATRTLTDEDTSDTGPAPVAASSAEVIEHKRRLRESRKASPIPLIVGTVLVLGVLAAIYILMVQ